MTTAAMNPSAILDWHAHVYFDASTRTDAWSLRELVAVELGERVQVGRFHEKPVGPHPMWSYQLAFAPADFAFVTGWLVLNHGALDVFVHPNTGDGLRDHRDRALWVGNSHVLKLAGFQG